MAQLLSPDEPSPLEVVNADGTADFVIICEHAGRLIPAALGDMGLPESELRRHIAWDIGAREISIQLSQKLDAPLYMQRYSRLVADCNRRPDVESFAPVLSESTVIPANIGLSETDRAQRAAEIHAPFHGHVSQVLDQRAAAGRRTILITIHSFTPVFKGVSRPWEIGVLYHRDPIFARRVLELLHETTDYTVGDNQPYSVGDDTDYAIPVHGEKRGLPCVEIEIRNDLTEGAANAEHWSQLIADVSREAAKAL